jgi:hypothetical protein
MLAVLHSKVPLMSDYCLTPQHTNWNRQMNGKYQQKTEELDSTLLQGDT